MELGIQAPVGFCDPAGITGNGNPQNVARRSQTELEHGRDSMLVSMGYVIPVIIGKLPGYLSPSAGLKFGDIPKRPCRHLQRASWRLWSDTCLRSLLRPFT